jgi:light-regulated signal transduction histidine kinase (bacteriophytochrome)
VVPLKARGRTFGAISLVMAESERRYLADDLEFAREIALRAGGAIDNARLAEARAEVEARLCLESAALARSNRELDQFAYIASHDLKAPLRGIANLSQWIEEDLADRMTDGAREHMALLRGRVHRLEALIDGILSYSRAGRGRGKVEVVDVGRLIAEVVELLAPPPGAVIDVAPGMPTVNAERVLLQQVLMNLIGNALKYAGGPAARVSVRARDAGASWEFSIADNGSGIAAEYQERIWGIFQVLESRDKVEGTGSGLSVVRKIVVSRGGRAWVDSAEGAGATFRFTWPKEPGEDVRRGP